MRSLTATCASWSVQGKDTQFHPLERDLWLMSLFWPLILFPTTTSSTHQDFLTLPHAHPSLQTHTPSCSSFPLCVCVCVFSTAVLLRSELKDHSSLIRFFVQLRHRVSNPVVNMCVYVHECVPGLGWSGILLHNWNSSQMKKIVKTIWIQPVEQLDRI